MDTHINAYYIEVDEAKAKLEQAKSELERAETALKAHPEYKDSKKSKPKSANKGEKPTVKKK